MKAAAVRIRLTTVRIKSGIVVTKTTVCLIVCWSLSQRRFVSTVAYSPSATSSPIFRLIEMINISMRQATNKSDRAFRFVCLQTDTFKALLKCIHF
jgi:hypothetical protein